MEKNKKQAGMEKHPCKERFLTFFLIWRLKEKPVYGYLLVKELKEMMLSQSKSSTIYAILARLEKEGLIKGKYDRGGARIKKMFQTTPKGWELFLRIKRKRVKGLLLSFVKALVE